MLENAQSAAAFSRGRYGELLLCSPAYLRRGAARRLVLCNPGVEEFFPEHSCSREWWPLASAQGPDLGVLQVRSLSQLPAVFVANSINHMH